MCLPSPSSLPKTCPPSSDKQANAALPAVQCCRDYLNWTWQMSQVINSVDTRRPIRWTDGRTFLESDIVSKSAVSTSDTTGASSCHCHAHARPFTRGVAHTALAFEVRRDFSYLTNILARQMLCLSGSMAISVVCPLSEGSNITKWHYQDSI